MRERQTNVVRAKRLFYFVTFSRNTFFYFFFGFFFVYLCVKYAEMLRKLIKILFIIILSVIAFWFVLFTIVILLASFNA